LKNPNNFFFLDPGNAHTDQAHLFVLLALLNPDSQSKSFDFSGVDQPGNRTDMRCIPV
jgi:hypothetical protein